MVDSCYPSEELKDGYDGDTRASAGRPTTFFQKANRHHFIIFEDDDEQIPHFANPSYAQD